MRTLIGLAIILAFLALGEALRLLGLPIPGNVTGMVLLAVALQVKLIKTDWIRGVAEFLADNLSLLFVPAGVGVMAYFHVVERAWLPVAISLLGSTLAVLLFTGGVERALASLVARLKGGK